ncbi:MAG: hypothetical protein FJZ95_01710 [Chloroflexi bacterium]|nr:hypothetical protein [Chloroflexota bacterium]
MRTKIGTGFQSAFVGALMEAGEDVQRAILGGTEAEVVAGTCHFPRGWKTVAESVGRYLEATGADRVAVARAVADAKQQGVSFGDIAAHFRRLRLGERDGNVTSLTKHIARAIDEYRARFSKTTDEQIHSALLTLIDVLGERQSRR